MKNEHLWSELLRSESWDERRVVLLGEGEQGGLVLEERTDGVETQRVYGSFCCVRRVEVGAREARLVARVLGGKGDVRAAVASFFSQGEKFLSQAQDLLDAAGVPYTYAVSCGNAIALRPVKAPPSMISSK